MAAVREEIIRRLPGKRWTKGDKDRLYVHGGECEFGITTEDYKSGNIRSAEVAEWEALEGADMDTVNEYTGEISNNRAMKLMGQKIYLNLKTGEMYTVGLSGNWLKARLRYLILKAEKEVAIEEEAKKAAMKAEEAAMKAKKEKKLTVEQAIETIATADTAVKLVEIFARCSVATLKVIAKATEADMGQRVLSRFKRTELLEVLSQHSDWLLNYGSKGKVKVLHEKLTLLERIKELKKSKTAKEMRSAYKSLSAAVNLMPLSDMAKDKVLMRGLTACTKKSIVSFLSEYYTHTGVYTLKMKKDAIISAFFAAKKAA